MEESGGGVGKRDSEKEMLLLGENRFCVVRKVLLACSGAKLVSTKRTGTTSEKPTHGTHKRLQPMPKLKTLGWDEGAFTFTKSSDSSSQPAGRRHGTNLLRQSIDIQTGQASNRTSRRIIPHASGTRVRLLTGGSCSSS